MAVQLSNDFTLKKSTAIQKPRARMLVDRGVGSACMKGNGKGLR